MQAIRTDW